MRVESGTAFELFESRWAARVDRARKNEADYR
jgi:hypothetical protein